MKRNRQFGRYITAVAIFLLVLVLLYSGLRILESTVLHQSTGVQWQPTRKTIVRDGVEYFPRQDVMVVLVSGIDVEGPMQSSGSYNNAGEADMVSVLIFNESQEKLNIISLNRDTMLEMPILGVNGKPAGTIYGQLALAHTYGSGMEDSSSNLKNTVSNLLYGINIDYYITLSMDAIATLNDAVDGVTVTVSDDFSQVDPTIGLGEVTLRGQQAVNFVRTRQGLGTQLNVSRMERQKEYMDGFLKALKSTINSSTGAAGKIFSETSDYMVTDFSMNVLSAMLDKYSNFELGDIISLEGENVKGTQYMEYYLDQDAMDQVMMEYLFAPKKRG